MRRKEKRHMLEGESFFCEWKVDEIFCSKKHYNAKYYISLYKYLKKQVIYSIQVQPASSHPFSLSTPD